MKIYFAYRSGYVPNNRHVRVFEADSVLDWFVRNWPILSPPSDSDVSRAAIEDLLGEWPYGFPICDYADIKEGTVVEPVSAPRNLTQLKDKLEEFVYSNEVLVSKNCLQVLTDDDEIELAWYVFDEEYAQNNAAKVSIWLHHELPLEAAQSASEEMLKSKPILPAGTQSGIVYWMSSVIHDSSHLMDLEGAYRIEGARLPDLLDYFRSSNTIRTSGRGLYARSEIRLFQRLCQLLPSHNQQQLLETWAQCAGAALDSVDDKAIPKLSLENVQQIEANSRMLRLVQSEHMLEAIVYNGFAHDYLIIFDDLWLAAHPELGQSLARFCSTWKI